MKLALGVFFLINVIAVAASSKFDWQGHRGARGLYPENTIQAMLLALKYPSVTTLELDVVLDKNLEVIVSHEPWVSQEICTAPKAQVFKDKEHNIFKMSYVQIQSYDCGSKPHPRFKEQKKVKETKPKLKDLFDRVEKELKKSKRQVNYNIEIKSDPEDEKNGYQPDVKTFTDQVIKTIRASISDDRYYIQSFDWRVLDYLSDHYPTIRRVALIEDRFDYQKVLSLLKKDPQVFSPYYQFVTKELIDFMHKKNIQVIPWTVNDKKEMQRLKDLGVDGIITDYPNLIP